MTESSGNVQPGGVSCSFCGQSFGSRNALFRHLYGGATECTALARADGLQSNSTHKIAVLFGYHGINNDRAADVITKASGLPMESVSRASSATARTTSLLAQEEHVSAVGDVLSFTHSEPTLKDFNAALPANVRVLGHVQVPADFHAELQCTRRRYEYLIPLWLLCDSSSTCSDSISEEQMKAAMQRCKPLMKRFYNSGLGLQSSNYTRSSSSSSSRVKRTTFHNFCDSAAPHDTVAARKLHCFKHTAAHTLQGHSFVSLSITCDAPLRQQVRRMVGLLVLCARGLLSADAIQALLDHSFVDTLAAVPPAPVCGVSLADVAYSAALSEPPYNMGALSQVSKQGCTATATAAAATAQPVWGQTVTAAALQQWRVTVLNSAAAVWLSDAEQFGVTWLRDVALPAVPALQSFLQQWRSFKAAAAAGDTSTASVIQRPLSPAADSCCDGSVDQQQQQQQQQRQQCEAVPAVYAEVLALLRAADASGMWPQSSLQRQKVIANHSSIGSSSSNRADTATATTAVAAEDVAVADSIVACITNNTVQQQQQLSEQQQAQCGSFSVGSMPSTCVQPRGNALFPELTKAAFALERALMPQRQPSSTIAINRHAQFRPHKVCMCTLARITSLAHAGTAAAATSSTACT
jgi:tRNA pseudouridine(38-40) synthase